MSLPTGARLGPYEIAGTLGAGGMGEVYRARDTRLERTVAIKILPSELSGDPIFQERFTREAKAIAALTHPNICALYDIGHDNGQTFLVLEFLAGQTLADRLTHGALPLSEALKIGIDITVALEAAHRRGITHRDLKPGNVMLTKTGAKLLDFGLAKVGPANGLSGPAETALPTQTHPITARGTILGTFQYMAPEQIEGEDADARTDVFAFGVVLYEMLTGRKAFEGKSRAGLLGAILKDQPPPVSQIQPVAPAALDYVVRTCLAKDPDERFQTAHDVGSNLKWIAETSGANAPVPALASPRRRKRLWTWAAVAALGVVAIAAAPLAVLHLRETTASPIAFEITQPIGGTFTGAAMDFAVSPDGRQIAVAIAKGGSRMLYVRPLGTTTLQVVPGTEDAAAPFWSADSRSIGFFARGKLKTVPVSGGLPVIVCDTDGGAYGGAWSDDDVILFASASKPTLQRVPLTRSVPTDATTLGKGETSHRWPSFLPGGRRFLYVAARGSGQLDLRLGTLGSMDSSSTGHTESNANYSAGHLVFVRPDGSLMAQQFDVDTGQSSGGPIVLAQNVMRSAYRAGFSASPTGVLASLIVDNVPQRRLAWLDRKGTALGEIGDPGAYSNLALSPDNQRAVVINAAGTPIQRDVYIIDLRKPERPHQITHDTINEGDPIWSPTGDRVIFNSPRPRWGLYAHNADGSGSDIPIEEPAAGSITVPDFSRDGKYVAYALLGDIWILPIGGTAAPLEKQSTTANEHSPAFSPDRHWIAYDAIDPDSSNPRQVWVQPFPATAAHFPVSRDGGWGARWSNDGKELFFLSLDGTMMAATIDTTSGFHATTPVRLFDTDLDRARGDYHVFDVAKNGRFFLSVPATRAEPLAITVVTNWPATIKR